MAAGLTAAKFKSPPMNKQRNARNLRMQMSGFDVCLVFRLARCRYRNATYANEVG